MCFDSAKKWPEVDPGSELAFISVGCSVQKLFDHAFSRQSAFSRKLRTPLARLNDVHCDSFHAAVKHLEVNTEEWEIAPESDILKKREKIRVDQQYMSVMRPYTGNFQGRQFKVVVRGLPGIRGTDLTLEQRR
eukprot:9504024-Pyramimonas_sp.AAC.2